MKKIVYFLSFITFLVITVSMISRNHVNSSKQNTTEISVRNDMMLEERR